MGVNQKAIKALVALFLVFLPVSWRSEMPVLPGRGLQQRTRTLFVPVAGAYYGSYTPLVPERDGWAVPASQESHFNGFTALPSDLITVTSITAVMFGTGSGDLRISSLCDATEPAANSTTLDAGLTLGQQAVDITAEFYLPDIPLLIVGSVSGEDAMRCYFHRDGANVSDTFSGNIYLRGWLVEYTADY